MVLLAPAPASAADGWVWPVEGELVTRYRNVADPYAGGQHRGIDVAAPAGRAVTVATAGTVTFAGSVGSSGLTVSIRTKDGSFDTSYLHLGAIDVREGDEVDAGAALGSVGATGRGSIARPHLHFGVREAGSDHAYRDPLDFLPAPSASPKPRPVPVPVPVTVPARPDPARVRAPAPRGAPWPAPVRPPVGAPGAVPLPGALPVPARGRRPHAFPIRRPLPAARPARRPAPAGRPEPSQPRIPAPAPAPRGDAAGQEPEQAPRPSFGPQGVRRPGPSLPGFGLSADPGPVVADRPARRPSAGVDLGWVVACGGLLLAGAALFRREAAQKAGARGRTAVAAIVRPLLGRG